MFACLHAPGNLPLLVDCANHFSPLIEETSTDTVVFDIRGLQCIYGAPEQIASAIHRRVGVAANLAIASNPDAADRFTICDSEGPHMPRDGIATSLS